MSEIKEINGCKYIYSNNDWKDYNFLEKTIIDKLNKVEQKIDEVLKLCQK